MIDTALCFSGGKDSLACLYLNKDRWNDIYVVWVNTQAVYEEQYNYMMKWKEKLPHFVEVKSNQPLSIYENGWPVDIVPVTSMVVGKAISGNTGPMFQSWISCCSQNIWTPLHTALCELGVTKVIKGQKLADGLKSLSRDGMVVDGVECIQPLDNWTDAEVFEYLESVGADVPSYYSDGEKTGRDCWDCTAYLYDNKKRIDNLPEHKKTEVNRRISLWKQEVTRQLEEA
jgi:3'-phosphoadenosine 5'-phosphosulfate sulfotransferase (PAPS reductase)/FAD synthetase